MMADYNQDQTKRTEKMAREIAIGQQRLNEQNPQYDPDLRYDDVLKWADNVNHPAHYTKGSIECLDAIKASMSKEQYSGYLKGAILKYIWRMDYKGKAVEDLKKAAFYLERLIKERVMECSTQS